LQVKQKSTSGGCQFIGGNLRFIKYHLEYYNINESNIDVFCDDNAATNLTKNLAF